MKKSIFWTVIAVLALIVVAAWGRGQQVERRALENHLLAQYQRSFYDLFTKVQNLEVLLGKSLVANGEQDAAIFSRIMLEADSAQEDLTNLPVSEITVARTAKFLTQAGDYAGMLARRAADGDELSTQDRETLERLYQQSIELSTNLNSMVAKVNDGSVYLAELIKESRQLLPRESPQTVAKSFSDVDKEMQQYPTIVYDGPFSDHLENRAPVEELGKRITPEEAKKKALSFIGKEPGERYAAKVLGNIESRIPSFKVEINRQNGNDGNQKNTPLMTLAVSKKGGRVVWMLASQGGVADISKAVSTSGNDSSTSSFCVAGIRLSGNVGSAAEKAAQFLARRGYPSVELTGYRRVGELVTFNFVPVERGIILYPDALKVTVAMDNGGVTGFDATEFLLSNRTRQLPAPKLTQAEARSKISPRLKVQGGRLAVIALPGGNEKLAYEFRGTVGDETYLVYINAVDGKEENILKIFTGPEGILSM